MDSSQITPVQRYQRQVAQGRFSPDPAQEQAVQYTQALFEALVAEQDRRSRLLARMHFSVRGRQAVNYKGLYFWGGVGRGKTWLVDAFHECLPFDRKLRMHFHRFMRHVHAELKGLEHVEDPLRIVADRLAERTLVLCFDEFHVSDITDAMLLGRLLEALFDRGVTLVATSNESPDQLYRDGLQRERFLPAIEQIKSHTHVVNVDSGVDYRMRYLDRAEIYHQPLDASADRVLAAHFEHLAPDEGTVGAHIEIEGRGIETLRCADGVAWFDFRALCEGPRGAADYIEIARQFQTIVLSNVPCMNDDDNDAAKRFINLIDEFYDRNVRLVVSAAAPPADLYTGARLVEPFRRTSSRLLEMQSHDYLAREHKTD